MSGARGRLVLLCGVHGLRGPDGPLPYRDEAERLEAEKKAAYTWNIGKVIRMDPGE